MLEKHSIDCFGFKIIPPNHGRLLAKPAWRMMWIDLQAAVAEVHQHFGSLLLTPTLQVFLFTLTTILKVLCLWTSCTIRNQDALLDKHIDPPSCYFKRLTNTNSICHLSGFVLKGCDEIREPKGKRRNGAFSSFLTGQCWRSFILFNGTVLWTHHSCFQATKMSCSFLIIDLWAVHILLSLLQLYL